MKKLFLPILALFLCFWSTLFAQKLDKSLLWEIKGNGIKKSYLYGTIHIISEKDFLMEEKVKKAFKKSKKIVMEIDLSQQMLLALSMFKLAPMKGDTSLADLVSKEDFEMVKEFFENEKTGSMEVRMIGFDKISYWKPMLVQSFLYTKMMEGEATKSYELEFLKMVKEQKKQTEGLETVEFQMQIFDLIPYKQQAEGLVSSIKDIKKGVVKDDNVFLKMVELYKEQDVDQLYAMSTESEEMAGSEEVLLTNRNKDWIPKIGKMAKTNACFFAVGAGHLGGENGVIRLLRKQGYTVTPVSK